MSSLPEVVQAALASIDAARGFDITFAGLVITFTALGTISLSISLLPHVLKVVSKYYPEKSTNTAPKKVAGVTEEVVAAIGLVYHSLKTSGK